MQKTKIKLALYEFLDRIYAALADSAATSPFALLKQVWTWQSLVMLSGFAAIAFCAPFLTGHHVAAVALEFIGGPALVYWFVWSVNRN